MKVVGYADRLGIRAGEDVQFMVSCESESFDVELVRLRHGDRNPTGPGLRSEIIRSSLTGRYPGIVQPIKAGSFAEAGLSVPVAFEHGLTFLAWLYPTRVDRTSAILTATYPDREGALGLVLTDSGAIALASWRGADMEVLVSTGQGVRRNEWTLIVGSYDPVSPRVVIAQLPLRQWPGDPSRAIREAIPAVLSPVVLDRFAIGALALSANGSDSRLHLDGKVDRPTVLRGALDSDQIVALATSDGARTDTLPGVIAQWRAGAVGQCAITDVSGNGNHGTVFNHPAMAVTGHNWSGWETDPRLAPEEYGAIQFHDDDLDDCRWAPGMRFHVPEDLTSGVYAAHLMSDGSEDWVPFFVRPSTTQRPSTSAVLIPTLSYLAYANEHMWSAPRRLESIGRSQEEFLAFATPYEQSCFRYILSNRLHSLYDRHDDGTEVQLSSRLRPIMNMRPGYNKPGLRFKYPHILNCDLYLIDWLETKGISFDILTDEDLHREGVQALRPYRALISGSHPEYWSWQMLNGLEHYQTEGGRFMYLGGNGFYWVTSIDAEHPQIIEVRRGDAGSRAATTAPGEFHHQTTGERGGLWRHRGRAPQKAVGVGFTAQSGLDRASPYRRAEASNDPRASFIFDGVPDALIGDFGLHMDGAAGWEIDRADPGLGTPPHALVVASSFDHSDAYQHVVEEVRNMDATQGGSVNRLVRADMVYYEGPNGGAQFSVGSQVWSGSLSAHAYENNVSRITENVLRRFTSPDPIPAPQPEAFSSPTVIEDLTETR